MSALVKLALALKEEARHVGIDDKNGINACKLLELEFTTALAILFWSREKALINSNEALANSLRLQETDVTRIRDKNDQDDEYPHGPR